MRRKSRMPIGGKKKKVEGGKKNGEREKGRG